MGALGGRTRGGKDGGLGVGVCTLGCGHGKRHHVLSRGAPCTFAAASVLCTHGCLWKGRAVPSRHEPSPFKASIQGFAIQPSCGPGISKSHFGGALGGSVG